MPIDPATTRRLIEDHDGELAQLALAEQCQTREQLAWRLRVLASVLRAHLGHLEAPGGLLEQAPSPGRLGAVEHEVWDSVQQALSSLDGEVAVDPASAVADVTRRLEALHAAEEDIVWGPPPDDNDATA